MWLQLVGIQICFVLISLCIEDKSGCLMLLIIHMPKLIGLCSSILDYVKLL